MKTEVFKILGWSPDKEFKSWYERSPEDFPHNRVLNVPHPTMGPGRVPEFPVGYSAEALCFLRGYAFSIIDQSPQTGNKALSVEVSVTGASGVEALRGSFRLLVSHETVVAWETMVKGMAPDFPKSDFFFWVCRSSSHPAVKYPWEEVILVWPNNGAGESAAVPLVLVDGPLCGVVENPKC